MSQAEPRLRAALLRWYRKNRRDLPWRRTADPYAIWVSEVLLQQTTVAAAVPRWTAFLRRFPTVRALALADETEVVAEWSGLGYYARARNLSRAARLVAARGGFPKTAEGLRALPGVGPYTAAAIASIAFGEPVPCLDGNVVRVLSRLLARAVGARDGTRDPRIRSLAASLVVAPHAGERNQSLMELGATVCRPVGPDCPRCPLRSGCRALSLGRPERYPSSSRRAAARRIEVAAGIAFRGQRLVLVPDGEFVKGHLALPAVRVEPGSEPGERLRRAWPLHTGRRAGSLTFVGRFSHSVQERRYSVRVFAVSEFGPARAGTPVTLVSPWELTRRPHGGVLLKALRMPRERAGEPARRATPPGGGTAASPGRPRRPQPWP